MERWLVRNATWFIPLVYGVGMLVASAVLILLW